MSRNEDMSECKQKCTRGAQQDALYNYFLENHPDHNLDDQTFMSLINTIIENIHSTEVHNWQHVMNGPASIDITFSVNTAFQRNGKPVFSGIKPLNNHKKPFLTK